MCFKKLKQRHIVEHKIAYRIKKIFNKNITCIKKTFRTLSKHTRMYYHNLKREIIIIMIIKILKANKTEIKHTL